MTEEAESDRKNTHSSETNGFKFAVTLLASETNGFKFAVTLPFPFALLFSLKGIYGVAPNLSMASRFIYSPRKRYREAAKSLYTIVTWHSMS